LLRLLRNRDVVFCLALVLGLLAPGAAPTLRRAVLPALALIMTLSTIGIPARELFGTRGLGTGVAAGLLLSYGLLSGFFLLASRFFPSRSALADGFLLLAAVPPAIAVIPFAEMLGGDALLALRGAVFAYLGGLVIAPVLGMAAWGTAVLDVGRLVEILLQLVALPLLAGALLRRTRVAGPLHAIRGPVVQWSFFIVIYTIVGLNQEILIANPGQLVPVTALALVSTFGLALIIEAVGRRLRCAAPRLRSLVLLGTLKNYGLAGGIALALFPAEAALPAVVCGTAMIAFAVWLGTRRT
jgi:BASS family bile acid:Na+ symporter